MKQRNMDGNKKTGKILFEAGILIMVVNLLSAIGIWQSILHDWKVSLGGDLFFQAFIQSGGNYVITYLNQESIYISFLSVLFSFLGNKEELVLIINLILQIAGIAFFYLGTKKLFRFVFPLAISMIGGLLSGCFYPVIADTSMHMIWFLSGLIFWVSSKVFCDISGKTIKWLILGILLGISCYVDFAGILLLITFVLFALLTNDQTLKEKGLQLLYLFLSSSVSFCCMFCLWNNYRLDAVVFTQWFNDKMKYCLQADGLNQYISLVVVLVVCIIFYAIKRSRKVVVMPEVQNIVEETISAEESASVETVEQQPEVPKTIKLIDNPLPLPKKHVKKEMNYAFEPTKDQMHYDLNNYSVDDDYDLKDI